MLDPVNGEALRGVFLAEAYDTLAVLESGLAGLRSGGEAVLPGRLDPLLVVTHRLRGAAALQGFFGVAQLAGAAEASLERDPGATEERRSRTSAFLADLAVALRGVLDGIQLTGREDADAIAAFTARYPTFFLSPPPEPLAPSIGADTMTPAAARGEALRRDMARFLADDPGVPAYFTPEALDHLESITRSLLALEQAGGDGDELGALFRAVHTLKGAAFVVGCTPVGEVAHLMEDVLAQLREERVRLTPGVIDALSTAARALRLLLDGDERVAAELPGALERAWAGLEALLPGVGASEPGMGLAVPVEGARPPVAPGPSAPAATPPATPQRSPASVRPGMRVELERLESLMDLAGELVIARSRLGRRILELEHVGELLSSTRARVNKVVKALEEPRPDGRVPWHRPVEESAGPGPEPFTALVAELTLEPYGDADVLARSAREIAADLAEVQAELAQGLRRTSEESRRIQRLAGNVRQEIVRAKMTRVGRLFARIRRQVREANRAGGKSVRLEASGESVELDNAVIAEITDPLLHLVQNAITHGIETEEERRADGKPPQGIITLSAAHDGNLIAIEVRDDGRGIDVERLKERAVQQGILPVEMARLLDEGEALDLIFLPGLSTAPLVTSRAGRGVGMDVVRTNLSRLNGEIRVETEKGTGTRFTLRLPLTTVVSEALMVRVGRETFAVPLSAVRKVLQVRRDAIESTGPAERLRLDDLTVDLIRLDRLFALSPAQPSLDEMAEPMPVILLRAAGRPLAVGVDALLGKAEIVIKALGPFLDGVGPFGGATISGEGRVILALDPGRLAEAGRGDARVPASATTGRALGEHPSGSEPVAARPILLVDDSVSVRKYVGHLLEKAGFRVVTAADGAEALERVEETAFAAVITDLEMPRVNGFELIRALRHRPTTQDVPVVVLTTRAGAKHLGLARWLGIEHYLAKPVDEEAFLELMAGLTAAAKGEVSR